MDNNKLLTFKKEMQDVLTGNILPFWINNMVDRENGGFYGRIDGHGNLHAEAEKGGILNGRILWTFSAAYRVLGKPEYLEMATRAKDYIIAHFIDREYGGTYWSLDYKGNPKDTKKQFYAIGFMIYGLSEYVRATGDKEALDYAIQLFDCIEEHSLDVIYNGYIEACTREWGEIADMRLSDLDANYPKSQNTHLHIIEPYANLYRVWKDERLEKALRNMINISPIRFSIPKQTTSTYSSRKTGHAVLDILRAMGTTSNVHGSCTRQHSYSVTLRCLRKWKR